MDGKTLISRTPFTLGTLLKALLFFTIGYVAFSRIAKRIQAAVASAEGSAGMQALAAHLERLRRSPLPEYSLSTAFTSDDLPVPRAPVSST